MPVLLHSCALCTNAVGNIQAEFFQSVEYPDNKHFDKVIVWAPEATCSLRFCMLHAEAAEAMKTAACVFQGERLETNPVADTADTALHSLRRFASNY